MTLILPARTLQILFAIFLSCYIHNNSSFHRTSWGRKSEFLTIKIGEFFFKKKKIVLDFSLLYCDKGKVQICFLFDGNFWTFSVFWKLIYNSHLFFMVSRVTISAIGTYNNCDIIKTATVGMKGSTLTYRGKNVLSLLKMLGALYRSF